jgi:hypothetical protein
MEERRYFSKWASEDSNLNTNDLAAFGRLSAQWNEYDAIWLPILDSNLCKLSATPFFDPPFAPTSPNALQSLLG